MFTASHNPAQYNGIKLCRAGARPVGLDTGLAEIRDAVAAGDDPVGADARARSPSTTCSRRTPPTCSSLAPVARPPAARSWSTPATAWPATPPRRSSSGWAPTRSSWCRCTSSSTAPSPTTRPTRSRPANLVDLQAPGGGGGGRRRAGLRRRRRPVLPGRRAGRRRLAVDAHRADRGPRAGQGAGRDGDPQPDHQPGRARARHRARRQRRSAPGSATPSSRRRWPRPARSSAASTAATSTSATSGAPTPACSPRCTRSRRWPSPTSRCRSCSPSTSATSRSGEINSTVADQDAVAGRDREGVRRPRRRRSTTSTGSPSASDDWWFNVRAVQHRAPAAPQRRGARRPATMARVRDDVLALIRSDA